MRRAIINYRNSNRLRSLFSASLCLGLLLICAISVEAQNTKKNTDYNPDKVLKSNARVNPSTLAMELSIPLGSYPGRAGNSMPLTFDYSSKVWQFRPYTTRPLPSGNTLQEIKAVYARRTAAGWTSSLAVPRIDYSYDLYRDSGPDTLYEGQIYNPPLNGGSGNYPLYIIRRLRVNLPDGSSHELRAGDAPVVCGDTESGCLEPNYAGTYLSVDGTRMKLVISATERTLYLPDGSRYLFGGKLADPYIGSLATAYIDSSGNKTTYNDTNKRWTDTLGRAFDNPLPLNAGYSQDQTIGNQPIIVPAFGTGTRTAATLVWSYLKDPNGGESGLENVNQALGYISNLYCAPPPSLAATEITGTALFTNQGEQGLRVCNHGQSYPGDVFNPVVLTKILLPNGQSYQFKYNVHGEIVKIIYPSGGYERFVYEYKPAVQESQPSYDQANRGVSERWVSVKGDGTDEAQHHWTYAASRGTQSAPTPYTVTITAPDGSRTEQRLYDEPYNPNIVGGAPRPYGFDRAVTGRSYEDRVYSNHNPGQLLKRHLTSYTVTSVATGVYNTLTATRDLRPIKEISIIFEPGSSNALATISETVYDTAGNTDPEYFSALNATQTKTYHYVVLSGTQAQPTLTGDAEFNRLANLLSSAPVASITEMDYLYDSNNKARNINGLVKETRVMDPANVTNIKARKLISYDESGYLLSSIGSMPADAVNSWSNPETELGTSIGGKRGLPTTVKSYYDATNFIQTHSFYDQYGNLRKVKDGNTKESVFEYDAANAFAYPTKTISPIPGNGTTGSNTEFITTTDYDYNTGLTKWVKDANGQVSGLTTQMSYTYLDGSNNEVIDPLLRLRKVTAPNGQQTIMEYGAGTTDATRYVKTRTQIDSQKWKEGYSWFDGLGRTVKTQSVDSAGDVLAETKYDSMGRVEQTSNPYRAGQTPAWTVMSYDFAGRAWKVKTPDNAEVTTAYGLATTAGSEIGTVTTVTDQALKKRRSMTNALGQLKKVDEPNASGAFDTSESPVTTYGYDPLGNLSTVNQAGNNETLCGKNNFSCSQTRSFDYDRLSRLKTAINPESGTVSYTYDGNGNLKTKIDARLITTTYDYDALNRVISRSYSDGTTPTVTYTYDGVGASVSNAKGKLTKVSNSHPTTSALVSSTEYTGFDVAGRVKSSKQTTNVNGTHHQYGFKYDYDLAGNLISQEYPSGRVVRQAFDADGDLASVSGYFAGDITTKQYAGEFAYTSHGAVEKMRLGNNRWETASFNTRLQPVQLGLGTSATDTSLWKVKYEYGVFNSSTGTFEQNNGNVTKQIITAPNNQSGQPAVELTQTYTYDSLNRLQTATENGTTQNWKQTFKYDRFGNRTFDRLNGNTTIPNTDLGQTEQQINPSINPSNNRFNLSEGYDYDAAGNLTKDANNKRFAYDGENKQKTFGTNGNNYGAGEYWYDADGKRVRKKEQVTSALEDTIFVYDAFGKLAAEYNVTSQANQTAQTKYLTTDTLGSPRVITNQSGTVESRRDFLPFGEDIDANAGGRLSVHGYGGDNTRQKFTAYERDTERNLDFAQARMYGYSHGRFTSPDPLFSSAKIGLPQSWNRYSYVLNNPLKFSDPTGMFEWSAELGGPATDDELLAEANKITDKKKRGKAINEAQETITKRNRIRDAMQQAVWAVVLDDSLSPEQKQQIAESIAAYGEEGDGNNVRIGIRKSQGAITELDQKTGLINVSFRPGSRGDELIISIAHEGRHVADAQAYWSEGTPGSSLDRTHYDREYRAYFVGSSVAQALGKSYYPSTEVAPTSKYEYWNKGWSQAEREEKRSRGIDNFIQKHYPYTPSNPGTRYSQEK